MKTIFITVMVCLVFVLLLLPSLASKSNSQQTTPQSEVEEEPKAVFSDLAAIYYYGNGDTRIHTWINRENDSFNYSGSNGWFSTKKGGYEGNKLLHAVSGDWDGDGLTDIAGFYDYGQGVTRIHVWLNKNGRTFDYQLSAGWWESTKGYDAKNIVSAAAGDYNGDGKDDIAAFYDYGNDEIRIHVWLSEGNEFKYEGSRGYWSTTGYPAKNIMHVLSGEFGK
jgi:hypothetical protein